MPATVAADNPSAFWQLGESSGTSAVDSSSGGTNSGTYQNSPTLDTPGALFGSTAGSVTLNGSNQYVSAPSGFTMFGGSSGFTIDGWVKPTAANDWARLMDFGNGASNNNVLLSVGGPGGRDLLLGIYNGSSGVNFSASSVINENVWQYVAATFVPNGSGGGTATLYLNGAVVNSGTIGYAPTSVTRTHNYIGKSDWNDPYFKGSIQDVAIYPGALSSARITTHYAVGLYALTPGSQTGLSYLSGVEGANPSAFWQLGESSGTTAVDSSSGGTNSGTYQNSPTLDTPGALFGSTAGSVTLNGTNQYVSVPSGFTMFGGSSGFTIDGWVKPTAANDWARLIDFGNGAANNNVVVSVGGPGGKDLDLTIENGSSGVDFTARSVITENVWQYVAATFVPNGSGGGTATLYLNGAVVNTGTIGFAPTSVTRTDNYIGKSNWNDPYFQGSIQDVAIYPSALGPTTVLAHYTTGAYELQPTSSYTYNGDGLRTSKTPAGSANPQQFVYDTTGSVPAVLSDGEAYYVYGADGYPLEMIQGTTVTWYHHDRLGSTRVLTDSSGTVIGTATYGAYGARTTTGATTPLGYAGAYEDSESSLVYLVHRYYDPATGQFLTVDPLVTQTGQPYSYAGDDPVNGSDPNGLSWYDPSWVHSAAHSVGNFFTDPSRWRAEADYGAGIANGIVSTLTLGQVHVAAPYCNALSWAYDVGTGFGTTATVVGGAAAAGAAAGSSTVGDLAYGSRSLGPDSTLFGNSSFGQTAGAQGLLNQSGSAWKIGWSVDGTVSPTSPGFRISTPFIDHWWITHASGF